jgi:2'-5' RNA ligase
VLDGLTWLIMRLFVASWLDAPHQRFYDRFIETALRQHANALRSIPRDSVHLTYLFCADAPEDQLDAIARAAAQAAAARPAFDIHLGAPRLLAGRSGPRLVCAHVLSGQSQLESLGAAMREAVARTYPDLSLSPTRSPHVTLARFRKQATRSDGQRVSRWLDEEDGRAEDRHVRINEVQIVESELTRRGPNYFIKARLLLRH